jgi:hypothetical protein
MNKLIDIISVFPNGNVVVFDHQGQQLPQYQGDIFTAAIKIARDPDSTYTPRFEGDCKLFCEMLLKATSMWKLGFRWEGFE